VSDSSASGVESISFQSFDGTLLPALVWQPPNPQQEAEVLLLHGMGSAPGEMAPLAESLLASGFRVICYAQRHQGLDPATHRVGRAWRTGELLEDFGHCMDSLVTPGRPVMLVGESMGALLALCAAVEPRWKERIKGLVLLCPVLELARPTPGWLKWLSYLLADLFPDLRLSPALFVHGKSKSPQLTADGEYQNAMEYAAHKIRNYTLGFTVSVGRLMEKAGEAAAKISQPVLVLGGANDPYITPAALEAWMKRMASTKKELRIFPRSYHLLFHDCESADVLSTIRSWMESHLLKLPGVIQKSDE